MNQSNQLQNGLSDTLCSRWWAAMGEIFGRQWYENYGPEPTGPWKKSLLELTVERAAAVLEHYRKSGDAYPPNLSQVMRTALEMKLNKPEPKMLEKPRSLETAAKACRTMKEILSKAHHNRDSVK